MSTLSEFYDFYDGPEDREDQFDFYASLFDPDKHELLELACGTGIITFELARRGFRITGIDNDEDMLAIASRKIAAESPETQKRLRLLCANMKDFSIGSQFGGVIIPTNSFGYLSQLADQRLCLKCVYEHLLPNGILVIEERNRSPERLSQMANLRGVDRTWTNRVNPQTGKYTMFKDCILGIDYASQTIFRSTFVDEVQEDGSIKRYVPAAPYFGNRNHYFTSIELRLLIESSGFTVTQVWGDWSKRSFTSQSNSLIVMAEKQ